VQEKLRTAERERAVAEARAVEERKRRRAQAALGLTFTSMVVLCGAFAWWTQDQRRARLAESERAMGRALEKAIVRFGQASGAGRDPALWAEARASALQAREQAVSTAAPAAVLDRINALLTEIGRIEKNRRLVASLLEIHAGMGDRVLVTGDQDFAGADDRYDRALRDYGTDLSRLAPERGAALLRELGGEITVELAAALDDWAYVGWFLSRPSLTASGAPDRRGPHGGEWLFPITNLLDPEPLRSRIRDAAKRRDGAALTAIAGEIDPAAQSAETINLLSVYLYFNSRFEDATRVLRAAQPHHSGDFQINHNLAVFLNRSSQPAEALPFAMAAVAVRPQSSVAWLDLARALQALGREEESYNAFHRVVERSPVAWRLLLPLASRMERAGRHEEAVAEWRRAAALAAQHPTTFYGFEKDTPRLRPGDDPAPLLAPLREAVKANPESAAARMTLAGFLLIAGNQEEAVTELREAARLMSDVNLYVAPSYDLKRQGKTEEAVVGDRTAIRRNPDWAQAHLNLGLALEAQGKLGEAIAEFRAALRLKPDSSWVQVSLYETLETLGALDKEVAACREAVRLQLGDAWAHANLAGALKALKKYDEAIAEFREAIRLKPDMLLAHVELGGCLWREGKMAEASIPWREAVRLNPDDAIMHINLGSSLRAQGKHDEAIAEYRAAVRLQPDVSGSYVILTSALRESGDLAGALEAARQALRIDPDLPGGLGNQARNLALAGRFAEAASTAERAAARQAEVKDPNAALFRGLAPLARRLAGADAALDALARDAGRDRAALETVDLAALATAADRPALAARLYEVVLIVSPSRAARHRVAAAKVAALAGTGAGRDDRPTGEAEQAALRGLALGWLRDELAARTKAFQPDDPASRAALAEELSGCRSDSALAGVRDTDALRELPEAERDTWHAFWAEVDALLQKARSDRR
jgi:tetratricopeptide (TPR) repeat protein